MIKLFLLATGLLGSSTAVYLLPEQDLEKEKEAIVQTALDYGDGFYTGSPERMARAIHPDLNKCYPNTIPQTGKTFLGYSTYSGLIEMCRAKVGLTPEDQRKIRVEVLSVNGDVACAKLTSTSFNDYLAMVKMEGQWKIVNVLWTFGEGSPNRKSLADFRGDDEKPAVREAVLDMIEGIYSGDVARVEKALHPEYRRATVIRLKETGTVMIQRDATGSMVEITRAGMAKQDKEKWDIRVNVMDCMDGLAFAELVVPTGYNYCQLAKIDGQWKMINILRKLNP